jgi:hypothetical protein
MNLLKAIGTSFLVMMGMGINMSLPSESCAQKTKTKPLIKTHHALTDEKFAWNKDSVEKSVERKVISDLNERPTHYPIATNYYMQINKEGYQSVRKLPDPARDSAGKPLNTIYNLGDIINEFPNEMNKSALIYNNNQQQMKSIDQKTLKSLYKYHQAGMTDLSEQEMKLYFQVNDKYLLGVATKKELKAAGIADTNNPYNVVVSSTFLENSSPTTFLFSIQHEKAHHYHGDTKDNNPVTGDMAAMQPHELKADSGAYKSFKNPEFGLNCARESFIYYKNYTNYYHPKDSTLNKSFGLQYDDSHPTDANRLKAIYMLYYRDTSTNPKEAKMFESLYKRTVEKACLPSTVKLEKK